MRIMFLVADCAFALFAAPLGSLAQTHDAHPPAGTPATGGTGTTGTAGPTPIGGSGNGVPGDNGGAGGMGSGAQAGAGGTGGTDLLRPSQLPNTGDPGNIVSLAIAIAGLLIVGGMLLQILRKHLT